MTYIGSDERASKRRPDPTCTEGSSLAQAARRQETSPRPEAERPFVEIQGLRKSFAFRPVLRGIDLSLRAGERLALLGANGAGKTTLLRILACLTRPTAGQALVAGLDCVHEAQEVRRLVGFVAHQPYLYEELTALENLLFFARMYGVARGRERALLLLERVGLARRARDRVGSLSRGQLQRLALARALLHGPRLLLLDEAETGLDEAGTALLSTLLAEHMAEGGTLILTTHRPEFALQQADRLVMLKGGRIVYHEAVAGLELAQVRRAYQEVVG
ncbi:MAG: heme ABC exporter ATP-binding protein CcmA [Thermogemmatispora sp.]|jgi:heme ABC exporter ATP-binding subunit CcmA|uniref:heme ABC exporter ATP-binding protein CcmA n=1 Tax=Thermogemmatispora TaxID=768669 RepID=UPI00124DDDD8|nr:MULTISPECIES: heme ABC exporter ATP-binding protein CcmA [Thermogemmatispora]MBE3565796.1 heme ABC exporter ATP-binding protein CcmA [Thermogemmatispora sp.]